MAADQGDEGGPGEDERDGGQVPLRAAVLGRGEVRRVGRRVATWVREESGV